MSLVSSQIRYMFLTMRQHDLTLQIQNIMQVKQNLAANSADLLNAGVNLDPNSPEMRVLEARRQRLSAIEKRLDLQLVTYQGQLKAVETEIESVRKTLDSRVKQAYSY